MSILKSSKSGRSAIQITLYDLLERGWYEPKGYADRICPKEEGADDKKFKHFLTRYHDKDSELTKMAYTLSTGNDDKGRIYTISIETFQDLDDLLNYWYAKKINKKRKYRDVLISKAIKERPKTEYWFDPPRVSVDPKYHVTTVTGADIMSELVHALGVPKNRI